MTMASSTNSETTLLELAARRGAILSDQDIKSEISNRNLIFTKHNEDFLALEKNGIHGDCYDLRVGYVLRKGQRIAEGDTAIVLKPGEVATLLSCEWLNLPANITGLVIPRNTPARRGILILNAGHVDPRWTGQIMAQVVNLSDQDRSIRLNSFEDSVFSVVFSYLYTEAEIKPKKPQLKLSANTKIPEPAALETAERKRLVRLQGDINEQADTLVLSESVVRERFVPRDRFTPMLWANFVGFLVIVGITVGILTGLASLTNTTIDGTSEGAMFGIGVLGGFVGATTSFAMRGLCTLSVDWCRRRR